MLKADEQDEEAEEAVGDEEVKEAKFSKLVTPGKVYTAKILTQRQ